ncbi:MAG: flagellar biosynthesis anti-sigma factor FlgM [Planctomycetes bacterium]|nr:flagellar biosynthesis anti-sigma factor FlgM [Planctomycetota bacterium]
MNQTSKNRLNRDVIVGYHSAVICGEQLSSTRTFAQYIQGESLGMDVSGLSSSNGMGPIRGIESTSPQVSANSATSSATNSSSVSPQDELELSEVGRSFDSAGESPEVRAKRIDQIKQEIENGTYDTDAKLEAALSRMFDSIGIDLDDE